MASNLLTARKVETATAQEKDYWLRDGASLFLFVTRSGGKLWRYRYRIDNSPQIYAIGRYPEVTLEAARKERDRVRELVKRGIHPRQERQARLAAQVESNSQTFEAVAREWIASNAWGDGYADQVRKNLEKDVFPTIGNIPIRLINVSHLRPVIKKVAERGAPTIAVLIRQWAGQIFRYASTNGLCDYDPSSLLKGLVKKPPTRHNPPLKWVELSPFLIKLNGWSGYRTTEIALRLVALTFVRTIEIRKATWDQFDLDGALWELPGEMMKMGKPHLVPLSRQAVALLRELQKITGSGKLLFPNYRRPQEPMCATTLNRVLERLGYGGQFSTHGFRSTATTILSLLGYPDNRVDLQLAHQKKSKDTSRAPYDHTKFISSRRIIMQDWADILDASERGATPEKITQDFGPLSARRLALLRVVERE
ncbi:tyrosine-type recombinase/integrase [Chitinimonas lacunae]|uniref:Tyrosine-type recombinase/integrase n=1 Tax=Chitinimonas lacunae TaxID=1963018 RepID=A0ABV8MUN2_9NEIS